MPKARKAQAKLRSSLSMELPRQLCRNDSQLVASVQYHEGRNLFLAGYAGTGKTYVALQLALEEIQAGSKSRIVVLRSAVPTRAIGFLPGGVEEKMGAYESPYIPMVREIFGRDDAYEVLKQRKVFHFDSTSFLRGITLKDCVVIVDEIQNCSAHELNTIMTRLGENSRVILCGDGLQSDLPKGQSAFDLLGRMVNHPDLQDALVKVVFTKDDIVRSEFVKAWIVAMEETYP